MGDSIQDLIDQIASVNNVYNMEFYAISGPTHQSESQIQLEQSAVEPITRNAQRLEFY